MTILNNDSEEFPDIKKYKIIDKALYRLKENTLPGKDGIIAEFIKEGEQKKKNNHTTDK